MISKKRNSQSGMTLIEVLTSLAILSLVVLPIASYFTIAAGARADSQSVAKATIYAENLLTDIKEQIEEDVKVQRAEENNPRFSGTYSLVARTASDGLRDYVKKGTSIQDSDVIPEFKYTVFDYFDKAETAFNAEYETDKYAYEAVIWRLDQETINYIKSAADPYLLNWGQESIKRGLRLYNNNKYQLDGIDPDAAKIKLPALLLEDSFITKDQYFEGEVKRGGTPNYYGVVTIDTDGKASFEPFSSYASLAEYDPNNPIDNAANRNHYKLKVSGTGKRTILVDATKVHKNIQPNTTKIEIENNSAAQLVIQVRKSTGEDLGDASLYNALSTTDEIDKRIRLVPAKGSNNIVFERPKDIQVEDVYLIAVIVRDLSPSNGKKGKIVKKMVEVYSYDYPNM